MITNRRAAGAGSARAMRHAAGSRCIIGVASMPSMVLSPAPPRQPQSGKTAESVCTTRLPTRLAALPHKHPATDAGATAIGRAGRPVSCSTSAPAKSGSNAHVARHAALRRAEVRTACPERRDASERTSGPRVQSREHSPRATVAIRSAHSLSLSIRRPSALRRLCSTADQCGQESSERRRSRHELRASLAKGRTRTTSSRQ